MSTTRVAVLSMLVLLAPAPVCAQSDGDAQNILTERPAVTPEQEAARLAAGAARSDGQTDAGSAAAARGGPATTRPYAIDVPTILRDGSPEPGIKK